MPATLSEKTARLKRLHILQAATTVFAASGFRGATIRMIAEEAGVSDGTIYNSFENKQALLLATLDPEDRMNGDQAGPPIPADPEALIRQMLRTAWAEFTPDNLIMQKAIFSEVLVNDDLRALYFERMVKPVLAAPEPLLASFKMTGQLKTVDVALILRCLAAAMLGFVNLRLLGDEKTIREWNAIPDLLAEIFISGLVISK